MATENLGHSITLPAAADLSSKQYRFMAIDSNGRVDVTGAGADAAGVLQNDPAAIDRAAQVMVGPGITKIEAGGACTKGANAASDADGQAVDTATGDVILGEFLDTATAAGEIIELVYKKAGAVA